MGNVAGPNQRHLQMAFSLCRSCVCVRGKEMSWEGLPGCTFEKRQTGPPLPFPTSNPGSALQDGGWHVAFVYPQGCAAIIVIEYENISVSPKTSYWFFYKEEIVYARLPHPSHPVFGGDTDCLRPFAESSYFLRKLLFS